MAPAPADLTPPIDTLRVAKLYAAFLGSPWADAEEQQAAARIEAGFPGVSSRVRHSREFCIRAAKVAVTHAARGVAFGAAGFPLAPQLHEEAAGANPQARFAYLDADPMVTKVLEALVDHTGRVAVCTASLRDPEGLLAAPQVQDLPRPLHLQMQHAAHFWPPRIARRLIGEYGQLLPSGSVVLLTRAIPADTPRGRALAEALGEACGASVYRHARGTVSGWLEEAGFEIMPPGARDVRAWLLPWEHLEGERPAGRIVAVIARKQ